MLVALCVAVVLAGGAWHWKKKRAAGLGSAYLLPDSEADFHSGSE